jgi:hypothetical protein
MSYQRLFSFVCDYCHNEHRYSEETVSYACEKCNAWNYKRKKDEQMSKKPYELLQESVETFKQRAEVYGDNYKVYGQVMSVLLKNGIAACDTPEEHEKMHNRLGLLTQIVSKLTRYCENFDKGGHDDSLNDLSVYAAMLRSLDQEYNEVPFDDAPKKRKIDK